MTIMKQRQLGKNGPTISEIGLGCWQLGGDWGDPVSRESGFSILDEAVKQGVSIFDTADVYGQGQSESLIGEFLKTIDTSVTVISKYGRGGGVYPDSYSEKNLNESVIASLERLQLDSLDLLQLHCVPQEILEDGQIFKWLRKLKTDGLIKNFGASIETIEQGIICMRQEDLLSLQVIFNIFRQRVITDLLPFAEQNGTGIIVRLPLASGMLSGKFDSQTKFPENDHRNYNRNGEAFNVGETFAGIEYQKGLDMIKEMKHDFVPPHMSMAQFALRWILDHKSVSCVIPGASKTEQVLSNSQASSLPPLSKELHESLRQFYEEKVHQYIRGAYL